MIKQARVKIPQEFRKKIYSRAHVEWEQGTAIITGNTYDVMDALVGITKSIESVIEPEVYKVPIGGNEWVKSGVTTVNLGSVKPGELVPVFTELGQYLGEHIWDGKRATKSSDAFLSPIWYNGEKYVYFKNEFDNFEDAVRAARLVGTGMSIAKACRLVKTQVNAQ